MRNRGPTRDELMMLECIALGRKGAGYVSPNPMVGAVLVKSGKVIARGYHKRFGGPHAEAIALRVAGKPPKGATLYTCLEPCNFCGKTPPCTDLIISSGIAKVVVGTRDPNPRVAGKGIAQLRSAGIAVVEGVLEDECRKLNEAFTAYITTSEPFVIIKVAQTLDSKIADANGRSKWITDKRARELVHELRSQIDAVLVGAGTVRADNPRLTVRNVAGRDPIRVVLDGRFRTSPEANVYLPSRGRAIVFATERAVKQDSGKRRLLERNNVEVVALPGENGIVPLRIVLRELHKRAIASLLVEGGARVFSSFLNERRANKLILFVSPKIMGSGMDPFGIPNRGGLPRAIQFDHLSARKIGKDLLIEAYLKK